MLERGREAVVARAGNRLRDDLRAIAFALARDHQPARDRVRDGGAEVASHQVQAGVDARGAARRGHDRAFIDVECVIDRFDRGIALAQGREMAVMRGRAPAIEQSGGGEHEHAGTDRDDSRAAQMRGTQRAHEARGRHFIAAAPARDHNGARRAQQLQPAVHVHAYAAGSAVGRLAHASHGEAVPGEAELRPRQAEHLDRDAELERAQPVVGDGDHQAGIGRHGVFLSKYGVSASSFDRPRW